VTTDTIRGAIVYREGAQVTQVCSFKKEGASEVRDYPPADIGGYGFDSRYFTSVIYKGTRQFMEVIVTGPVRLLRSNKVYYLVKDTAFAPLEARKTEKYINGRRYESEDKTWLGRVKPMLSDCQAVAKTLDGVQLSALSPQRLERKFSEVITQYNECRGEKTTVYDLPKTRRSLSVGFLAGVTVPTARFTHSAGTDRYSGSLAPVFGVWLEWSNPRVSERFRLRTEVSYVKVQVDGTDQYGVNRGVRYSAIKVPLLVHYSFSSGRVAPFVRAGVACNFPFGGKYHVTFPGVNFESSDLMKFTASFLVAGGLETIVSRRLRGYIEARYEFSSRVYHSRTLDAGASVSQSGLGLGVRF
jgi:hypothetical protein